MLEWYLGFLTQTNIIGGKREITQWKMAFPSNESNDGKYKMNEI